MAYDINLAIALVNIEIIRTSWNLFTPTYHNMHVKELH